MFSFVTIGQVIGREGWLLHCIEPVKTLVGEIVYEMMLCCAGRKTLLSSTDPRLHRGLYSVD